MTLGDLIRRYRLAAGLSQEDLAERAGLSVRGISDLERGRRLSPHMETLRLLSEGLGLDEEERALLIEAARPELRSSAAHPREPGAGARARSLQSRALPVPLTMLVGRDELVDLVASHIVDDGVRLITLTGPGGVGKTRVGLEAVHRLGSAYRDGVIFVDLALLSNDQQFGPAILDSLAFTGNQGADPVGQLIDLIRDLSLLILLDNFEHMLDSAVSVARILAFCPDVAVIVTSRTRLRLRGELVLPVPPLSLPDGDQLPGEIDQSPAVRLFVERAKDASTTFAVDDRNAESISRICRQLDGLPLAIELAASWLRVLSPSALLEQLNDRLPALGGGARDAPDRHQTLRQTLAWSLEMLAPEEQRLFRIASVFSGGARFEAIQSIAASEPWDQNHLVNLLSGLVDNSLIRQSVAEDGTMRYAMLETVQAYGREQATELGEEYALRSSHATWVRSLAEATEFELVGPSESHWRNRLVEELANIRSALSWSIEQNDIESGLRISGALWRFWSKSGNLLEGREWLTRVLALTSETDPALEAKASQALANMSLDLGDYTEAQRRFERSLSIRRTLPDQTLVANALNGLGLVAFAQGDHERALDLHRESLELSREAGSLIGIGNSLSNWADVEMALGNLVESRKLQEEGLAVRRELGDVNSIAYSLYNLGVLARQEERFHDALDNLTEATEHFRSAGDLFGQAYGLCDLGVVRSVLGDREAGATDELEALRLRLEISDQRGLIDCVEAAARIGALAGNSDDAFRLIGAASSRRLLVHAPRTPAEAAELSRWSVSLVGSSNMSSEELLEEGEALSLPQAVTLARTVLEHDLERRHFEVELRGLAIDRR